MRQMLGDRNRKSRYDPNLADAVNREVAARAKEAKVVESGEPRIVEVTRIHPVYGFINREPADNGDCHTQEDWIKFFESFNKGKSFAEMRRDRKSVV